MSAEPVADTDLDPRVARTREVVAAAVQELLAGEGLDAVTHTRVAEAAGVGRATLYRHWPDAASLVVDAIRQRHGSRRVLEGLGDADLREAATALVRTLTTMLVEDPMVPAMLSMLERAEHDPAYAQVRDQVATMQGAPLDELLRQEKRAGRLPDDLDLDHAKSLLVGPLFFARLVLGRPVPPARTADHVDAWLRAIAWSP